MKRLPLAPPRRGSKFVGMKWNNVTEDNKDSYSGLIPVYRQGEEGPRMNNTINPLLWDV